MTSAWLKLFPETVTLVPPGPSGGTSDMVGTRTEVTRNVACPESPPLPDTVTMYDCPFATFPTVKLPLGLPLPAVTVQAPLVTTALLPETVQLLSVNKKPAPVKVTAVPTAPLVGVNIIVGPVVTVNVAWAESPPLPDTVITEVPGDVLPTMKLPLTAPVPIVILQPEF